jgi:formylmethanofuran dehydrogenase subunit C
VPPTDGIHDRTKAMLRLAYRAAATVPVEVEGIRPDVVCELAPGDIERLPIFHGNQKLPLAEFFRVEGDAADRRIEFEGDLSGVHWIGAKMTAGTIRVAGNAGRHVGSDMRGGQIHVEGNAGDWVGGEMHGGLIRVSGRAGHLIGAAYRGSRKGMTGGTILVVGDAGNEIGHSMRRGLVAVGGSAGDLAGFNMLAGSVLVFGSCGIRPGAGMRRGTIGLFGADVPELLPTFTRACRFRPEAIELVFASLKRLAFVVPEAMRSCLFELYHGDMLEGGRGEVLIAVR